MSFAGLSFVNLAITVCSKFASNVRNVQILSNVVAFLIVILGRAVIIMVRHVIFGIKWIYLFVLHFYLLGLALNKSVLFCSQLCISSKFENEITFVAVIIMVVLTFILLQVNALLTMRLTCDVLLNNDLIQILP